MSFSHFSDFFDTLQAFTENYICSLIILEFAPFNSFFDFFYSPRIYSCTNYEIFILVRDSRRATQF